MKLIFFDLNGTLIHNNSWEELNMALGISEDEDQKLLSQYNKGEITYPEGQKQLAEWYKERMPTRSEIEQVIYNYTFMDGAKEVINYLKKKEYVLILLSGSMDLLVKKVGKELEFDIFESNNTFVFDEKQVFQDILVEEDESVFKKNKLIEICIEKNVKPSDCVCIGDGLSDKDIFLYSQRGITFPGSDIEPIAWKTIHSLRDLHHIF